MASPSILLFTGHLIDSIDRQDPRFPLMMVNEARSLLKKTIDEISEKGLPKLAVSSLAAGGDMIFAELMVALGVPFVIFLPFEVEKFLSVSVTYQKNGIHSNDKRWEDQFHNILRQAREVIITGTDNEGSEDALVHCNNQMLAYALEESGQHPDDIVALALVRAGDEIKKGGSTDFVGMIKSHCIAVMQVWPYDATWVRSKLCRLESFVPTFATLEKNAIENQRAWKSRFHFSLIILASIAFFDAFVTIPDYVFFGYGKIVRVVSLISSVVGAFITLRLQVSDKRKYRGWTQNRAKVEQIRSEIWYFMFDLWSENNRLGPYTLGELRTYFSRLSGSSHINLLNETLTAQIKTNIEMISLDEKIRLYRDLRLQNQIGYFTNRSKGFTDDLKRAKLWTMCFLLISVGWGTLKMLAEFYPIPRFFSDFSPLGMMISFIALVATYVERNNMDEMEFKYSQMAKVLITLNEDGDKVKDRAGFDAWVKDCEAFLRTQNNEWSLKRDS